VDFTFYKPATIVRRVERRLNINQCSSLAEYADLVERSDEEVQTLYKELLIGVTRFFRDEEAFDVVRHQVIPQIVQRNPDGPIRVWVAGCSTGEEAYSLAMLFVEHLEANNLHRNVMIFATDLDREAVEYAAEGAYPESIVADLSPERLNRFFVKRNEKYYIKRQLREMIIFAPQNITKDPPFSNMDLVCCRNLLIYLQPAMQKRVLALMAYSLKHQGFLFLGSSETLGESVSVFRAVDARRKVYQKVSSSRRLINETLSVSRIRRDLGKAQPAPAKAKTRPANTSDSDLLQSAMQELMRSRQSCAVILDESCIIRHVFGRTENIIQLQPGKASLDARKIMNHDLSIALSTAVSRAGKTGQEVVYARIQLPSRSVAINLRVRPLPDSGAGARLFLGLFEQVSLTVSRSGPDQSPAEGESNERIRDLEQELQFTKANLQSTIEELQTSNEELQATNEELVTSNEELQSTNEELQSVNEELHTVNSEYQEKIEELTQLNNDMDNLLRATQIGVLFLDKDLQIRKFTPKVAEVINIMSQDIGRPVNHITCKAPDLDLVAKCREAIDSGVPDVQEIHLPDEQVYMARFVPYWTGEDQLEGLVVTFVEVTAVHMDKARHQSLMDITKEEIAVLDPDGNIIQINPAWGQMVENIQSDGRLRVGADFVDQSLPDLMDEADGEPAPQWQTPLREVLANRRDAWSVDLKIKPDKNPRRLTATSLSGHERGAIIRLTRLAPA
jgi:two-component system CheB/CheR fusion protein